MIIILPYMDHRGYFTLFNLLIDLCSITFYFFLEFLSHLLLHYLLTLRRKLVDFSYSFLIFLLKILNICLEIFLYCFFCIFLLLIVNFVEFLSQLRAYFGYFWSSHQVLSTNSIMVLGFSYFASICLLNFL